jgi:hypothetical protein
VREESRQDKEWVVRLRSLPDAPETFYLTGLMASHDFQTALQNYLDMEDLRRKLLAWQGGFDAFEDVIRLRQQNYEPLLPAIDAQFRELDSQIRLRMEQRDNLERRLQNILTRRDRTCWPPPRTDPATHSRLDCAAATNDHRVPCRRACSA